MSIDELFPQIASSKLLPDKFSGTIYHSGILRIQANDDVKEIESRKVLKELTGNIRYHLLRKYIEVQRSTGEPQYIFFFFEKENQAFSSAFLLVFRTEEKNDGAHVAFEGYSMNVELTTELITSILGNFGGVFSQAKINILLIGPFGKLANILSWNEEDSEYIKGLKLGQALSKAPESFQPFAKFIMSSAHRRSYRGEITTYKNQSYSGTFVALHGNPLLGEGLGLGIFRRVVIDQYVDAKIKSVEKLYQQLFELSPAGMLLEDTKGYILDANQALLDATGYQRNDILGKHVSIFASLENLPHVEENIQRIVQGEKLDVIVESRRRNGEKYYSRLIETLVTLSDGQKAILSISSDITDRVLIQRQLEEEKEKYRRFFDNVYDIFFISTPEGIIRHVSPSVEKFLGYTPDEILLRRAGEFYLNPKDRDVFIAKLKAHQEVVDMEIPLVTRSGAVRYFSLNAHGIYTHDGALQEIEGTFRDITEKKQYLAELEEARLKAEESAALKSSLLSNMSHEVRTPLNSILGFSQMLFHNHPDPAVKEVVQKIHASGERLLKTLESIMLVAQLDSGLVPEADNWPLDQALARVFLEYQSVAEEKGLLYLLEAEDDLWVYTDEKLLSICVKELIDNAIKFTREGGITLRLKAIQSTQGPMARIEVRDTGIGIPMAKHDLIFKEFRQASEGMSRSFEGLGLGLSIVRRLVHLLGGTLTFESNPGVGTVFYLDLPRITDEKLHSDVIPQAASLKEIVTIPEGLLVEDNAINAEITASFLEGICALDQVPTYYDALKLIQYKKYDFFLIDISLGPGPTGIDLLKKIKELKQYRDTPVVAVTGFAQHGDSTKLKSLGFTHYIAKPFTRDEIVILVQKIFKIN